jgi:hypothetical protein
MRAGSGKEGKERSAVQFSLPLFRIPFFQFGFA